MEGSKLSPLLGIPTKLVSKIKESLLRRDLSHYEKISRQPDDYK
jgi:hypothetical protein